MFVFITGLTNEIHLPAIRKYHEKVYNLTVPRFDKYS